MISGIRYHNRKLQQGCSQEDAPKWEIFRLDNKGNKREALWSKLETDWCNPGEQIGIVNTGTWKTGTPTIRRVEGAKRKETMTMGKFQKWELAKKNRKRDA